MRATFIETSGLSEAREEHLLDASYAQLQQWLMMNAVAGAVMPGCGGLRKVRVADAGRGKGKRGGSRVIYLHVPEAKRFFMIHLYGKDQKDDLSRTEKRILVSLADVYKRESIAAYRRWLEDNRV